MKADSSGRIGLSDPIPNERRANVAAWFERVAVDAAQHEWVVLGYDRPYRSVISKLAAELLSASHVSMT